jgi:hypothetical protein
LGEISKVVVVALDSGSAFLLAGIKAEIGTSIKLLKISKP